MLNHELYTYCSSIVPILFEYCTNIVVIMLSKKWLWCCSKIASLWHIKCTIMWLFDCRNIVQIFTELFLIFFKIIQIWFMNYGIIFKISPKYHQNIIQIFSKMSIYCASSKESRGAFLIPDWSWGWFGYMSDVNTIGWNMDYELYRYCSIIVKIASTYCPNISK